MLCLLKLFCLKFMSCWIFISKTNSSSQSRGKREQSTSKSFYFWKLLFVWFPLTSADALVCSVVTVCVDDCVCFALSACWTHWGWNEPRCFSVQDIELQINVSWVYVDVFFPSQNDVLTLNLVFTQHLHSVSWNSTSARTTIAVILNALTLFVDNQDYIENIQ